ncbi:MAG: hypothetical protein ACRC4N_15195 [Gammaproteobacteria bacterium]
MCDWVIADPELVISFHTDTQILLREEKKKKERKKERKEERKKERKKEEERYNFHQISGVEFSKL